MKFLKTILRGTAALAIAAIALPANAESIVYVFSGEAPTLMTTTLFVNGVDAGNFNTAVKKHHESNARTVASIQARNPQIQIPIIEEWDEMYAGVKKCVIKTDGPTVFVLKSEGLNLVTREPDSAVIESTIDIEDGKTYYLEVAVAAGDRAIRMNQGELRSNSQEIINADEQGTLSAQLVQMSEKDGKKKLKDKKIHAVADYVEE